MLKPELVLSNTTTFFSGNIERVFKKAKKHGFKYLEIIPYRWTNPANILSLERKYNIKVVGIHMPEQWKQSLWREIKQRKLLLEKLIPILFWFYLQKAPKNPGFELARILQENGRSPYLLFHSDLLPEIGKSIKLIAQKFNLAIENAPHQNNLPSEAFDPVIIRETLKRLNKNIFVFDPAHYKETVKSIPSLSLVQAYKRTKPDVLHIGYNDNLPFMHALPNNKSQKELVEMLRLHSPKYIVIETNPLVSVKKAKALIERLIKESQV